MFDILTTLVLHSYNFYISRKYSFTGNIHSGILNIHTSSRKIMLMILWSHCFLTLHGPNNILVSRQSLQMHGLYSPALSLLLVFVLHCPAMPYFLQNWYEFVLYCPAWNICCQFFCEFYEDNSTSSFSGLS